MKLRNRAETILEVLVGIVILTVVLTGAFAILSRAVRSNINVKNRVIALNIVRDGIEGVRNIRDTNWLKYSGSKRENWLCVDDLTPCTKISNGFYTIDFDGDTGEYLLEDVVSAEELDLEGSSAGAESFRLYEDLTSTDGRVTHNDDFGTNPETVFYRQIELEIGDPFDSPPSFCDALPCTDSVLRVISRVQWEEDIGVKEVVAETHLFDFYERGSYE